MIKTIHSITEAANVLDDICAAVFDLDDTLYSEKEYVRSGFAAVAGIFPQIPDMGSLLWTAFEEGLPAIDKVLEDCGLAAYKDRALAAYRAHMPEIHLYAGVKEMLLRLSETKKLGLITDGRPEGQRAKIEALGLADLFDEIIITDELGGTKFRKPSQEAYVLMQRLLNVPFGCMAYIGDNPRKDFIAPEKLGMRCVWFKNPDGLYCEEER